jgi:release factor glutamine methyltransferase
MDMVRWSGAYLADKGVSSGRLDAERLLADVLGVERLELYLQFDRPLTAEELAAYKVRLQRRARREPLQYILGRTAFRELELLTDPRALIPRPETEGLVELVLEHTRSRGGGLTALDLGTGTGAIALSLLQEGPFDRVVATDVSRDAVALARANAERCGLLARLDLRVGDLWQVVARDERFDVVVSNPPYVSTGEMAELQPEVGAWEPRAALEAGALGLDHIEALVAGAPAHLRRGGLLALEVGAGHGPAAAGLAGGVEGLVDVRVDRDLAGRDRYVFAWAGTGAG